MKPLLTPQMGRVLLIACAAVAAYATARHFLVPDSFGRYGWFRGDALAEIAAAPLSYAGMEACAECHEDVVKKKTACSHKSVACEACHGPEYAHAQDPTVSAPTKPSDPKFCLRCHSESPSRPRGFPMIGAKDHGEGDDCMKCHPPHSPEEVK